MIKLSHVSKKYKEFQINHLSLQINQGELVTFLGESGSGKSTLLKIMLGLIDDYSGEVFIGGKVARGIAPLDLGVSMVFQEALLLPHLNVGDNILFGLQMLKIPKKEQQLRLQTVLKDVYLTGFEARYPHELSGGQMQRVALARALVMQPKVLLMDEPFSALDQNLRIEMQHLLKSIQRYYKSTIVFVTHDRDEAFFLSDKIALLRKGNLLQYESPQELYSNPIDVYTAKFMGITNIFIGEIKDNYFIHEDFTIPFSHSDQNPCTIAFKSNDLSLSIDLQSSLLQGTVHTLAIRYGMYFLELQVGRSTFDVVQSHIPINLKEGDLISIQYHDAIVFKQSS